MITMTARQRVALARLRINHPRATVVVSPRSQTRRPDVKVKMTWPRYYSRVIWLQPDGGALMDETKINWHHKPAVTA